MQKRQRMSRAERREQIIGAALDAVAKHGVRGATLTSIAAGVGITYPALYAHFPSRKHLLLALIDHLSGHIREVYSHAYRENAVDHLREIGLANSRLVAAAQDGYVLPFFEFVAADPEDELREALGQRQLVIIDGLADIVRRGQRQGSIVADADPEQVAWMVAGCGWTDDIAALMGLDHKWVPARSQAMLDWILDAVTAEPKGKTGSRPAGAAPQGV